MTKNKNGQTLVYPTVFKELHDDGDYYVVTSPNIPGMVTQGETFDEAFEQAQDAIATMLDGEKYPDRQDPSDWELEDNDSIVYVPVNMVRWMADNSKTEKRLISIPKYLNERVKRDGLNLSALVKDALIEYYD